MSKPPNLRTDLSEKAKALSPLLRSSRKITPGKAEMKAYDITKSFDAKGPGQLCLSVCNREHGMHKRHFQND